MRFVKDSRHPVELVLRVLGIASSTYYWWCKRLDVPSARQIADEALLAEIVDIHTSSAGTHGSPRVHAMLARRGVSVGRKRVERVMRGAGLQGAFLRKRWRIASTRTDPRAAPAPDLVEQSSPRIGRIGCGWLTRPGSPVVRARSGWQRCGTHSPTGSWAGKPQTAATPNWCWVHSSSQSGAATSAMAN